MERESALGELATAHAVALRMHDAHAQDDAIAAALGIPADSVPALLALARLKLDAVLEETGGPAGEQTL